MVTFLDMDTFLFENVIHTKEHRKETSAEPYLFVSSAHARHTFAGIVKSQLYRVRRLCSLKSEFIIAVDNLKVRCLKSGYDPKMVEDILKYGKTLERRLENQPCHDAEIVKKEVIRLAVLSGTQYEKQFVDFAKRINNTSTYFFVTVVYSTVPTLGRTI